MMHLWQRLKPMLVKELLQMVRDVRMRAVVFGLPVIQMLIMAFALTTDVTRIRTAVLDWDRTPASRALLNAFTSSGYFDIHSVLQNDRDISILLDHARVTAVVVIPAGFENERQAGRTADVQILLDGTDSNTSAIVLGYAMAIVQRFGLAGLSIRGPEILSRAWFNVNLESRLYFVPALIAVMLLVFSILLTSIGIVREKEIGTIEQIMVTPIRKIEYILGKTIPYLAAGYVTMSLMLTVAMAIFDVRIHGNVFLLYLLTGIYLFGNLGIALIVSASARTQQQALLTAFLILMPCVLLSGFMFPIRNMPESIQIATWLNPMRWYLEILRGIVMKGVGIRALWQPIVCQTVLAVAFIGLAARGVKKTLA
uniref:ABC transporter permease n=1 Tax=Desulfatirhabdium butyrativorans TaxID=340467 RepID=A0A7C4RU08_9BACT